MEAIKKKPAPTLRKFMHPRNPYKHPPSFKQLSLNFKKFRQHCIFDASGKVYFDFKNPDAVSALTTCLLERDYNLEVNIPKGSLVPTLPLRFNYLLWIEDLLGMVYSKDSLFSGKVIGCDIGTGSSAIYPLLGVKQFKWSFIASENDKRNFESARNNVLQNNLQNMICLKHNQNGKFFDMFEDPEVLFFIQKIKSVQTIDEQMEDMPQYLDKVSKYKIDFTMCNPPFFSSEEDMESTRRNESVSTPPAASTGYLQEKVVDGGEISFITQMIQESTRNKDFVRLFSTLIGKQKDIKLVKKILREEKVAHYKITEFCQGRTMRWGAVWTFDSSLILENYFSKKEKLSSKPLLIYIPRTQLFNYDVNSAWNLVHSWLLELKIKPKVFKKENCCIGAYFKAYKANWLHQRRKKRQVIKKKSDKRKAQHSDNSEELDMKRIKLDNSSDLEEYSYSEVSADMMLSFLNSNESEQNPEKDPISGSHSNKITDQGLECLIRANIFLVQKNGILSIEMKYLGGKGGKECAFQLIQFLKNKVGNGPHT